jgi:hypothetical protein
MFMRIMAIVITAMLTISSVDSQAFAAANPDRTQYRGAGSCRGAAYCSSFRANKTVKLHKAPNSASQ